MVGKRKVSARHPRDIIGDVACLSVRSIMAQACYWDCSGWHAQTYADAHNSQEADQWISGKPLTATGSWASQRQYITDLLPREFDAPATISSDPLGPSVTELSHTVRPVHRRPAAKIASGLAHPIKGEFHLSPESRVVPDFKDKNTLEIRGNSK